MPEVICEVRGRVGCVTLNRPGALNALSLHMIRRLTASLQSLRDDDRVLAVAVRGMGRHGPFGSFCAGGDIRFFHQAALAGDSTLDDFFTEEYRLNHLIHNFHKPVVAFMDGVVMGGGMGIAQGASLRIVTGRTRMAMPETNIGLFPDVGGGYFLSRCPGHVGEYLALTGQVIGAGEAIAWNLADTRMEEGQLNAVWDGLGTTEFQDGADVETWLATKYIAEDAHSTGTTATFDHFFSGQTVLDILRSLDSDGGEWAAATAAALRMRSPLMLHVALEQIRRARGMSLSDDLRMERDLVHHCFHMRPGTASETVEGIRALAVDKDSSPVWNPARIEDVRPDVVHSFFEIPWTPDTHPLRDLQG